MKHFRLLSIIISAILFNIGLYVDMIFLWIFLIFTTICLLLLLKKEREFIKNRKLKYEKMRM